jgi:hypothetical protein
MISKGWAARLAVLALVLAGCTSKPAPSSSPSTPRVTLPSASPSPSDARAAAVQAGVDAYRGMWRAYNDAIKIPDPDTPDLPQFATGKALTTLVGALRSVKDQGLKGTGQLALSPHATKLRWVSGAVLSLSDLSLSELPWRVSWHRSFAG